MLRCFLFSLATALTVMVVMWFILRAFDYLDDDECCNLDDPRGHHPHHPSE